MQTIRGAEAEAVGDGFVGVGFFRFCRKNPALIATTVATVLVTFWIKLWWPGLGIDSELYATNPEGLQRFNIGIGRWGLALAQRVWDAGGFHPRSSLAVALVLLAASALSWCYVIDTLSADAEDPRAQPVGRWVVFTVVYLTSAVWAEQFYFVFQSVELGAALLLCPWAGYLLVRGLVGRSTRQVATAAILMLLVLAVYQATAPVLICAVLVCFLMWLEATGEHARHVLWRVAGGAVGVLAGVAIAASVLARLARRVADVPEGAYLDSMSVWGSASPRQIATNIAGTGYQLTLGQVPGVRDLLEPWIEARTGEAFSSHWSLPLRLTGNFALLPLAVAFIAVSWANARRLRLDRTARAMHLVAAMGVPATIIALAVAGGNYPPVRTLLVLPVASAFMFHYLITSGRRWLAVAAMVLALAVAVNQAQITTRLLYSDHLRYEDDVELARDLERSIRPLQPADAPVPVALIGAHRATDAGHDHYLRGDTLGWSFFEWWVEQEPGEATDRGLTFMATLGSDHPLAAGAQLDAARTAALTMPSYPADGSVIRLPDLIVVKLSDSLYAGPVGG